jgi:hypothetical protein
VYAAVNFYQRTYETQNSTADRSGCYRTPSAAIGPMETVQEDVEEYTWREVVLPRLIPVVQDPAPELDRENGERRRGRDLLVAVDFGPNSKHAFDWALAHLARIADTVHLVHAVSS